MKLSMKLIAAPVATALVVLSASQLQSWLMSGSTQQRLASQAASHDQESQISELHDRMYALNADLYRSMTRIADLDEDKLKALQSSLEAEVHGIQTDLQKVSTDVADPVVQREIGLVKSFLADMQRHGKAAFETGRSYPAAGLESLTRADDSFKTLTEHIDAASRRLSAYNEEHQEQLAQQASRTLWWMTLGVLLATAVVVALSWRALKRVADALASARDAVNEVAKGNLSVRLESNRRDEIGDLQRGLAQMVQDLERSLSTVRDSAEGIRQASQEIALGNTDLSARTEQTASNLEEITATVEQLTGTVAQSAHASSQANQFATSAAEVARQGGEAVGQVIQTMNDIQGSSRRIADIIGVIDGIAFQTNILALNAAVEAARACEQGRGFAVVAGEVRSLAQRSADAAREIKTLINDSVAKVESGSQMVHGAGQTMQEIVVSVQRVSDIIGDISAGNTEQHNSIREVHAAITHLDNMTQQNAALVEQSAAASAQMSQQAERLTQVVRAFRMSGRHDSGLSELTPLAPRPATPVKRAPAALGASPVKARLGHSAPPKRPPAALTQPARPRPVALGTASTASGARAAAGPAKAALGTASAPSARAPVKPPTTGAVRPSAPRTAASANPSPKPITSSLRTPASNGGDDLGEWESF